MTLQKTSRLTGALFLSLAIAGSTMSGCGVSPIALNLNGTYNLTVTNAPSGSLLPMGTTGPVVIANGLLTSWLSVATTNPQNPTVNGSLVTWKATVADPGNPLLSTEVTLSVTDQGGGTLTGEAFLTILTVATPASQVTLQLQ